MSLIKELLGLEDNLDEVAHEQLGEMIAGLRSLNSDMNHLVIVLDTIRRKKQNGTPISESIRENFLETLKHVKKELVIELELEEKVRKEERTVERREATKPTQTKIIRRIWITSRSKSRPFKIGSVVSCDMKISELNIIHVEMYGVSPNSIAISPRDDVVIERNGVSEHVTKPIQVMDREFILHLFVHKHEVAEIVVQ